MTMLREWFSAAELATMGLPSIPGSRANVLAMAERGDWQRDDWKDTRWRARQGKGGGVEFHYSVLPLAAQAKLTLEQTMVVEKTERDVARQEMTRAEMWAWFDCQPDGKKIEARRRLEALDAIRALQQSGVATVPASQLIAAKLKVSLATLYGWRKAVHGQDRHDWLPYLAPRHTGRIESVECDDEAWDFIKSDWLRLERPTFQACFARLLETAKARNWTVPSARTLQRRLEELPEGVRVLKREGVEALKRMYPAQTRDRGVFHALEAVNADGHQCDVFVKWPDGSPTGLIGRPIMVAFQDLYSGKILSWRVDRTENKELVRLAFGDMVEHYGIPDHCWLDNGRSFASKWLTGRTPNRYRFKVKDEDPAGIMTELGVEIHWTTPYHGQAKPIERAWRDFAGDIAKHPAFAGAYTGNNPMAKPENYASKAVPIDDFLAIVGKEIAAHNARVGRRSVVCQGRSFDATFDESYAKSPIKKATVQQRLLWLLAAEAVKTAKVDGAITLMGNRYWADFLAGYRGQKVTVRFDPQALHAPLHVYRLDGAYLGSATCIEAVGFADVAAGRVHAQARGKWAKAQKAMAEAEVTMTPAQVAAMLPEPAEKPPAPETKVVRLFHGATALAIKPEEDEEAAEDAYFEGVAQMNRALRGSGHLRAVINPDGDD